MRRRALQPGTEPSPASPLKIVLPEEFASSTQASGGAAALLRGGMVPRSSCAGMPASPLRFSPLSASPSLAKQRSPDRWLNHDLSSAPRMSPNHARASNSLRDSWFDVEWRPPPGLEGLGPPSRLADSPTSLARSPGNRSTSSKSTAVHATAVHALNSDANSPLQFRQPTFPSENDSQMIKTPPPPSRVAMAVAKRFFLSRHTKDCTDPFKRWRRHALLNALQRRQSDDAVREWRRRNSRRMIILLKQGVVASQMDRLAASKRLERSCARSLMRAAYNAMAAYSNAKNKLCSALQRIRSNIVGSYQHRFFSLLRRNCEMSYVLVHRADCFHQAVVSRSLATFLSEWKCATAFRSKIQTSFHAALRRWMFFAAAKTFGAWQSLTLLACSNRDTAIKWRISCDRRRVLAYWAEISRQHKRIKAATTRMWMQNDSRTVTCFLDAWKSVAAASSIAFKAYKSKWRIRFSSAVFDCWCSATGSLTALRLFVNGCNHKLCRFMFLNWRSTLMEVERKLHRAGRAALRFLQKKCVRGWRHAASFKIQGRTMLSNSFVTGWCTHLLMHFFSKFRSRVRDVKIQSRISYYRCVVYQTALLAWKANVFDETQALGSSSPVKALRQSTAKRMWAHQFPLKSPSKSLRSSQQFIKQTRSMSNQAIDLDKISETANHFSRKLLLFFFNGWVSVLAEIQATRRLHAAAMQWHYSVHIRNILAHVFKTLITFSARSRTRLALKSKKCTEHYAAKLKRTILHMWKKSARVLRHFRLQVLCVKQRIAGRIIFLSFQHWMQWSRKSRVRDGYLRRVVEPCIEDNSSKRLLACFRRAFGAWREFLTPRRLSKRFARRCLLKVVGQFLVQWHHVALCTVDDRVADAIAVSRRKFSLLRFIIRAWSNVADEIRNRPQLAEADMWFSRRLLRRVFSSWDQQRLLIRTQFAESSRRKDVFRTPASQSRLEAALEQEMTIQLNLNQNMQNALVNPKIAAPVKVVIGEKQTPWRAHAGTDAANSSHVGVPTSVGPVKVGQLHLGKTPGNDSIETPRTVTTSNKAHSQRPTPAISTSSGIATPQSLLSSVRLRSPVKSKGDEVIEQTHGQSTDQTTVPSFAMITTSGSQLIMKYLEQSGWLRSKGDDALLMWVPHPRDIDFDRVLGGKLIVNQLRGSQYLCAPTGLLQIIGSAAAESLDMLHKLHPQWVSTAQPICACAATLPPSSILYPQSVVLSDFLPSAHSIPDAVGAWILKAAKPSPEFKYVILDNTTAVLRRTQSQCRPVKSSTGMNLLTANSAWRGGSDGSVGPGGAPIMPPDTLVQKYVQQPLLLGGRKFTISCYLLVLSVRPAFVLLNPGFIRRAVNKYEPSDLSDEFGHSTNLKKMRQHPNFLTLRDDCALSISKLSPAFKGLKNAPLLFDTEILPKIRLSLTATLLQSSSELLQARGSFGFLSANFIIDSNLNPWLLSMDRAPDLEAYNAFQDAFLPSLVQETVKLTSCFFTEHARDDAACRSAVKLKMRSYSVLLDERK